MIKKQTLALFEQKILRFIYTTGFAEQLFFAVLKCDSLSCTLKMHQTSISHIGEFSGLKT